MFNLLILVILDPISYNHKNVIFTWLITLDTFQFINLYNINYACFMEYQFTPYYLNFEFKISDNCFHCSNIETSNYLKSWFAFAPLNI